MNTNSDANLFNPGDNVWFFTDEGPRRGLLVKITVEYTLRDVSEKYFTTRISFSVIKEGDQFPKMIDKIYKSPKDMARDIEKLDDPVHPVVKPRI